MKEEMLQEEQATTETTQEATEETGAEVEEVIEVSKEEELEVKVNELEDQLLRVQAEMINMRNRNQKERELAARYRSQDLAKELLPAIDNLERALETEVTDENGENLKKGVEMVRDSLLNALNASGVEVISALGETFDPNLHQAVQTMPVSEGQAPDEVIHELQKGYKLHDRVLRPTMVIVAQ
ncbi:nucleotide exchange factor GrpE [Vagococcus zengguangii]|uniref:Protein GrpE n=1 Tax=Vagococcus zengguangii TaxID=2571750 RepID=A0A4D7CSS1_9ENTE|nr:nucleotide exchange factor GrpE [Vagococcus zengguangii]QCI87375.1 nucleotide exchange factor GrpE [Vagococcus zengguangii]TLG81437.1 nucleotide exchange factor GrpE [Vagococcus zengguangii]